jgi:hypothetical protein
MRTPEIVAYFRSHIDDELEPFIWTETEVLRYLDRAQENFLRAIGGLADTHTCYVHADQESVQIPENLLKIRLIRDVTHNRVIALKNVETAEYQSDPYQFSYDGRVPELILGERENQLVFTVPPSQPFEIKIYYYRTACKPITSLAIEPEVPARNHMALIHNMMWQAYSKQDSDGHDKSLADRCLAMYTAEVAQAMSEKDRREHVPRATGYGGI